MLTIDLSGRVALVVGGSRGIGGAITECLCQAGAATAFTHTGNPEYVERVEGLVSRLSASGHEVQAAALDAREPEATTALVQEIVARHGHLDVLVQNAGRNTACDVTELTDGGWREGIDTNLSSAFYAVRAALPHMVAAGHGRIVLVGESSNFGRRWDQDLAIIEDGALAGGHTETIPGVEAALDGVTSDHWRLHPDTDPVLNVAADGSIPMSTITVVRNTAWEAGVDAPAFLVARSGSAYHPNYGAVWTYTPPRQGLVEGTPVWMLTVLPDGVILREPDGTEHPAERAEQLLAVVGGRASRNAVLLAMHDDRATLGDYLAAVVALSSVELFPVVFHAWVSVQEQPARLAEVRAAEEAARAAPSERDWRSELAYRTVGDVVVGPVPTDWWVEEGDGKYRRMKRPPE